MTRKKKPNKATRDKKRAELANVYEQGFLHGYEMGIAQALKDAEKKNNGV